MSFIVVQEPTIPGPAARYGFLLMEEDGNGVFQQIATFLPSTTPQRAVEIANVLSESGDL